MAQEREVVVKITPKADNTSAFRELSEQGKKAAEQVEAAWKRVGQSMSAQSGTSVLSQFTNATKPIEKLFQSSMQMSRGIAMLTGDNKNMEQLVTTFMKFQAVTDVVKGTGETVRQLSDWVQTLADMPLGGNRLSNFNRFFGAITEGANAAGLATDRLATSTTAVANAANSLAVVQGGAAAAGQTASAAAGPAYAGSAPAIALPAAAGAAGAGGAGGAAAGGAAGGVGAAAAFASGPVLAVLAAAAVGAAAVAIATNVGGSRDILISSTNMARQNEAVAQMRQMDNSLFRQQNYYGTGGLHDHAPLVMRRLNPFLGQVRGMNDQLAEEQSRLRHADERVNEYTLARDMPYHQRYVSRAFEQLSRPGSRQANLTRDIGRVRTELERGDATARARVDRLGETSSDAAMMRDRLRRSREQLRETDQQVNIHNEARRIRNQIRALSAPATSVAAGTFTNAQGYAQQSPQILPPMAPFLPGVTSAFDQQIAQNWYTGWGSDPQALMWAGAALPVVGAGFTAAAGYNLANPSAPAPTTQLTGNAVVPGTGGSQAFQSNQQIYEWVQAQTAAGNTNIPPALQAVANNQQTVMALRGQLAEVESRLQPGAGLGLEGDQLTPAVSGMMNDNVSSAEQYTMLLERQQQLQTQIVQQEQEQIALLRRQREETREIMEARQQEHQAAADRFRQQAQGLEDQSSNEAVSFELMDEGSRQRYMDLFREVAQGGQLLPDIRQEALGMGGPLADMIRESARQRVVGIDGQGNQNTASGRMWAEIMQTAAPNQLSRDQQIEALQNEAARQQTIATNIELEIRNNFSMEANSTEIVDELRVVFAEFREQLVTIATALVSNDMAAASAAQNALVTGGGN